MLFNQLLRGFLRDSGIVQYGVREGRAKSAQPLTFTLGIKMTSISTSLVLVAIALGLAACSEKNFPESEVYTLYSTNYPTDVGRSGVATFDLANIPELNGQICQEAADLYQADFEKKKIENGWSANTKMRHWCEKGRFKK